MKAARFHDYGAPLVIEDVPVPEVGPGQVLIKVAASGANPADVGIREGHMKQVLSVDLPHIPNVEVAGVVEAVGDGVDNVAVGESVVGFLPMNIQGAAAEYALAPAEVLASAPTSIPLVDAAAMPATALTAQQALFEHGQLRSGQRVLVNGAGGTVGGYAVQLAVRAGAEVIATVSPKSVERVTSYGPAQVIDHTTTALADAIDTPVDLALNFGPTPSEELAPLVTSGGRIVSGTGPVEDEYPNGARGIRMAVHPSAEQLAALVELVDQGDLSVWVEDRRPLEEINEVQAGSGSGKTVLIP